MGFKAVSQEQEDYGDSPKEDSSRLEKDQAMSLPFRQKVAGEGKILRNIYILEKIVSSHETSGDFLMRALKVNRILFFLPFVVISAYDYKEKKWQLKARCLF